MPQASTPLSPPPAISVDARGIRRIGVISDTHGLLRPAAVRALAGVGLILHAGDVGREEVLDALKALAWTVAVRGNVDLEPLASRLPSLVLVETDGGRILLVHDKSQVERSPLPNGTALVVCGHSHRPGISEWLGVGCLNPGSAGPRRFGLPVSLGFVEVDEGRLRPGLLRLES